MFLLYSGLIMSDIVVKNDWDVLRKYTAARIGLGRTGISLPTKQTLAFALDHARARDAVYLNLDTNVLEKQLENLEFSTIKLNSKAKNRETYLQRPDLGRELDETSAKLLEKKVYDLVFVIADGLSSRAIHDNAVNFISSLSAKLEADTREWSIAPICIVKQGRVAIGDEIGQRLDAKIVVVLIGERPGLSSPDSLGFYMTWNPQVGLKDSSRNCISNIRSEGLSYDEASNKALYLITKSTELELSGVNLKERSAEEITCRASIEQ